MSTDPPESADGRRRKGERRRQRLLAATVRLIGRAGIAAVTQRAVAAEAGLPPSAVLYYFATVDELLVAALTMVNDRYLDALDALPADRAAALWALAELITEAAEGGTDRAVAEYELCLLAARRPQLRGELDRWTAALDALAGRLVADPAGRPAFAVAVDGLFLRAATGTDPPDPARTAAVLARLAGG
jgi:TetR/AcrR family transcriptional regulator, regulator of biofilm formation and stress response